MNRAVLPSTFPLDADKPFYSEKEWVCLQLICQTTASLANNTAANITAATNGYISEERAAEIIEMAAISQWPELGTWFARLLVESGMKRQDLIEQSGQAICQNINQRYGYPLCKASTADALDALKPVWNDFLAAQGS